MKKKILMGTAIATAAVLSAGATAGYLAWRNPAYADVVGIEPVTKVVMTPDKACRGAKIAQRKPADENAGPDIVIDGMAGGVIRHQDAEGAAAIRADLLRGDAKGDQAPKKTQEKDTYSAGGLRCRAGNRVTTKVIAYDVRYRLFGKTAKVRMDHDPGRRLPVKNGKVVVTRY